jgi:hypothetical protein
MSELGLGLLLLLLLRPMLLAALLNCILEGSLQIFVFWSAVAAFKECQCCILPTKSEQRQQASECPWSLESLEQRE